VPALWAAAVVLAFGAAWELAGAHGDRIGAAVRRGFIAGTAARAGTLAEAALWLRLPERIRRAGLGSRVTPSSMLAAKGAGAALGAVAAVSVLPAIPGRLALVVVPLLVIAGFLAPDALLERAGRLRRAHLVTALPDALDLLATGAASGRPPPTVFGEIADGSAGPLAVELAIVVSDVDSGVPQRDAIEALHDRVPGAEVGAFAAVLARSRRYGSPLADQLHDQATALRRDARRRTEERAARAAPKIQLVVALVLVPSVLLMILAAIVAHSDRLFGLA
jgi:tight adherence protein C